MYVCGCYASYCSAANPELRLGKKQQNTSTVRRWNKAKKVDNFRAKKKPGIRPGFLIVSTLWRLCGHCLNSMGQAGDFARCKILVESTFLSPAHQFWLGKTKSLFGRSLVTTGYRFFDLAQEGPDAAAPHGIDFSLVGDLPHHFFGRLGVRHISIMLL